MAGKRGMKKFETFTFEDGSEHIIYIESKTGDFVCDCEGTQIRNISIMEVRKALNEKLRLSRALTWEMIIVIDGDAQYNGEYHISFDRYYQATKADGTRVFKYVSECYAGMHSPCELVHGRDYSGTPYDSKDIVYGYSQKLWDALEYVKEQVENLESEVAKTLIAAGGDQYAIIFSSLKLNYMKNLEMLK